MVCFIIRHEWVTNMKTKYLLPLLLVAVLSGCASTGVSSTNDPVRARVVAELQEARANGSLPLTEAQYIYPNWVGASETQGK
jgi:hypothetical protein